MRQPAPQLDSTTCSTKIGTPGVGMHVVLIEDDADQAALLMRWFQRECLKATHHSSASDFLAAQQETAPDLVLLDWNLPGLSGGAAYSSVREAVGSGVPVLLVTASTAHDELASMLGLGADDVLVKPLRRDTLLSRVRAYLNELPAHEDGDEAQHPSRCQPPAYSFDDANHCVKRDNELLVDDERDYALARELLEHPRRLIKRQALVGLLCEFDDEADENSLQTRLTSVTERLGWNRPGSWRLETVLGCGYRLEPPRQEPPRTAR